jgi:hypothetical protein
MVLIISDSSYLALYGLFCHEKPSAIPSIPLTKNEHKDSAGDRLRYAIQFADVLQTGEASTLLQLPPDKRIHIMKTLTLLARFQGCYDRWMQIHQRYGLTRNTYW